MLQEFSQLAWHCLKDIADIQEQWAYKELYKGYTVYTIHDDPVGDFIFPALFAMVIPADIRFDSPNRYGFTNRGGQGPQGHERGSMELSLEHEDNWTISRIPTESLTSMMYPNGKLHQIA